MTIVHKELFNWWNGKVIIDEIKEFTDDRGCLVELWRTDDQKMADDGYGGGTVPLMSYWSITKPFVVRGPHQHENQTDWFVTFKGLMVYQLYNPSTDEMKHFITDPTKIYRVKVAPPIIHSYRNLSVKESISGNFPTALFMGKDKKGYSATQKIDEIRHEHVIEHCPTIWVFGSNGRLGKALVNRLYKDMGYHKYNVVPLSLKIQNDLLDIKNLESVLDFIKTNKKPNDVVVNCIAKTDVQNQLEDFEFENVKLPIFLAEFCVMNQIHFLQFSTDYVFQTGEISKYTESKIKLETWFENALNCTQAPEYAKDIKKYVKFMRVANLFSQDEKDVRNVITKVYKSYFDRNLRSPANLVIMPTDVEVLAEFISKEYLFNIDSQDSVVSVSGKPYSIHDLVEKFIEPVEPFFVMGVDNPKTVNRPKEFLETAILLNCDVNILNKFVSLKQQSKS
jgi:dTDP-4-dehydrorhamnose 3,5-epimerase